MKGKPTRPILANIIIHKSNSIWLFAAGLRTLLLRQPKAKPWGGNASDLVMLGARIKGHDIRHGAPRLIPNSACGGKVSRNPDSRETDRRIDYMEVWQGAS